MFRNIFIISLIFTCGCQPGGVRKEKAEVDAVTHYNRGVDLQKQGDLDKAIADYTDAIRLDPKDPDTFHNRAVALKAKGELDKAEADFAEAKRLGMARK